MNTIPTQLTAEQAKELTDRLLEARKFLRDAAGPRMYLPNYIAASNRLLDTLTRLGVDAQ